MYNETECFGYFRGEKFDSFQLPIRSANVK